MNDREMTNQGIGLSVTALGGGALRANARAPGLHVTLFVFHNFIITEKKKSFNLWHATLE